jgi:predicted metalloprotease with PDZ domain
MKKTLFALSLIAAAGVATAALFLQMAEPASLPLLVTAEPDPAAPPAITPSAAIEDRVAALEKSLATEQEARRVLEDELVALYTELERLKGPAPVATAADDGPLPMPSRASRYRETDSFEARSKALVDEGLSAERAAYILQRESELRFAQMQAYYEARNAQDPEARLASLTDPDMALREEIGEAEYEKYLRANNRSTSVEVEGVMSSSPAASAGLQPGDEIVRYGGERVYNSRDLIEQAMDGEGTVVVEVLRDGTSMQVIIPRGPLGIEVGRRRG